MQKPSHWLFWVVIGLLLFVVVPYGFMGEVEPLILGLPRWLYVSLTATTIITMLSIYRIWRNWD